MSNEHEKADLLKMANELYEEALNANSYYSIIMHMREMSIKSQKEMNVSPAFYSIVLFSLHYSCFMELAKIYDASTKSVRISTLLDCCQEHIDLFNNEFVAIADSNGEQQKQRHTLHPREERFYKDEVEKQRNLLKMFNLQDKNEIPITIEITIPELLDLYRKRICSLNKEIENIREQRNKIYAHNDMSRILSGKQIWEECSVSYQSLKELIDAALDITIFIIASLTGKVRPKSYINIDDLETTLNLVKIGLKYQCYDCEKECEQTCSGMT